MVTVALILCNCPKRNYNTVKIYIINDTYAALTYTEYPLRILKFEIHAEITEYDANGRGGACTKRCLCESVKNACGSLQIS